MTVIDVLMTLLYIYTALRELIYLGEFFFTQGLINYIIKRLWLPRGMIIVLLFFYNIYVPVPAMFFHCLMVPDGK